MDVNTTTTIESPDDDLFARWQQTTLIVIPYVTAPISLASSSLIVYLVGRDWKRKKQFLYHRLLLAMSLCDIIGSINLALSGLVIPEEYDRFGSRGNVATCEMAGFLMQICMAVPLLNMFLCIFYMRVVCFGWVPVSYGRRNSSPSRRLSRVSSSSRGRRGQSGGGPLPWFETTAYLVSIVYPLAAGGVALHYNSFNPMLTLPGWCSFSEVPYDCNKFDDVECIRGEKYLLVQLFGGTIPVACAVVFGVVSVTLVSRKVRKQHLLMTQRYGITNTTSTPRDCQLSSFGDQESANNRLKETAQQARLYTAAFVLTYVAPILQAYTGAFMEASSDHRIFFFTTGLLVTTLTPLQGFWNLLIYIRPIYRRIRQRHATVAWWTALYWTLSTSTLVPDPEARRRRSDSSNGGSRIGVGRRLLETRRLNLSRMPGDSHPSPLNTVEEHITNTSETSAQSATRLPDSPLQTNIANNYNSTEHHFEDPSEFERIILLNDHDSFSESISATGADPSVSAENAAVPINFLASPDEGDDDESPQYTSHILSKT